MYYHQRNIRKNFHKKKKNISKHNINFENFKKERSIKFRNFSIVMGVIFVFANFLPTASPFSIGVFIPAIFILCSPAIVQYVRGNLNWTTWIWYCLGMCIIGIGFIFLFFFMPPKDRLEKEYREFILKKKLKNNGYENNIQS